MITSAAWSKWFDLHPRKYVLDGVLRSTFLRKGRRFEISPISYIHLMSDRISPIVFHVFEWEIIYGRKSKGVRPLKGYKRRSYSKDFATEQDARSFISKEVN